MVQNKLRQIKKLVSDLANDTHGEKLTAVRKGQDTDVGLINQFRRHKLIPNLWFEWESRLDAKVMIIGQDWGPYIQLKKHIKIYKSERLMPGFDYDRFLIDSVNSRTEKFILQTLQKTYFDTYRKTMPDYFHCCDNVHPPGEAL